MYSLKKLDITSVALYSFVMILIISLVFIIPFGLFFMAVYSFLPETGLPAGDFDGVFPALGWGLVVLIPIIYALIGTITNVLIALLYNLLSKKLGGIKFSLEKVAEIEVDNG